MEILIKNGNEVVWRETNLELKEAEKLDDNMVHCHFSDRTVCFIGGDTKINGVLCDSADEIVSKLNA